MNVRGTAFLIFTSCVAMAACQQAAAPTGLSEEDVAAIRQLLDGFAAAELAGDWDRALEYVADDVVAMPANQPAIVGRAALREFVESVDVTVTSLSMTPTRIDGRGDLAYAHGSYTETLSFASSPQPVEAVGKFLWVFEKGPDGVWRAKVAIANSDQPAEG